MLRVFDVFRRVVRLPCPSGIVDSVSLWGTSPNAEFVKVSVATYGVKGILLGMDWMAFTGRHLRTKDSASKVTLNDDVSSRSNADCPHFRRARMGVFDGIGVPQRQRSEGVSRLDLESAYTVGNTFSLALSLTSESNDSFGSIERVTHPVIERAFGCVGNNWNYDTFDPL